MVPQPRKSWRTKAAVVGGLIVLVGGCHAARSTYPSGPVQQTPGAVSSRPEGGRAPCQRQTVIVKVGQKVECDLTPPQILVVVFKATQGGDAELERLDNECLDMGGKPSWERGRTLFCRDVDY